MAATTPLAAVGEHGLAFSVEYAAATVGSFSTATIAPPTSERLARVCTCPSTLASCEAPYRSPNRLALTRNSVWVELVTGVPGVKAVPPPLRLGPLHEGVAPGEVTVTRSTYCCPSWTLSKPLTWIVKKPESASPVTVHATSSCSDRL